MKINEIVTEGQLRKGARRAIPDLESYPELDNNNNPYLAYRFGVELAVSPDHENDFDKQGGFGSEFATIGYTEADRKILDHAKKRFGIKSKKQSGKGSKELPNVNVVSPVPARKKNKYGV